MSDKEQDGMISCDDGDNEDRYVYSVEYAEDGQYLTGPDDKKIGPFMSIYLEDISLMEKKDFIFRYIDKESGLIGYMDQDGNAMTEAIFTEASKVADGPAIVKEKTGGVYYIDRKSFKRISEDFKDIECREVLFGEDAHIEHNMEIICQKEDGTREVIMRAVR